MNVERFNDIEKQGINQCILTQVYPYPAATEPVIVMSTVYKQFKYHILNYIQYNSWLYIRSRIGINPFRMFRVLHQEEPPLHVGKSTIIYLVSESGYIQRRSLPM